MTQSGILSLFATHPFLGDLSIQHRLILASGVRPFQAAPGEYLAREGNTATAFYLIQAGHVAIETARPDRVVPIQTVGPGEILGWSWIVPPYRWRFDCRAGDHVQGLAFDAAWLRDKCDQDHELGYHFLRKLLAVIASRLAATRLQLSQK